MNVNVNRVYYFFIIIHDGIIFMIALYIDAITGQDRTGTQYIITNVLHPGPVAIQGLNLIKFQNLTRL